MLLTLSIILILSLGFLSIALSMKAHFSVLLPGKKYPLATAYRFKALGFSLIGAAGVHCCATLGIGHGLVLWCATLSVALLATIVLLSYRNLK